MQQSDIEQEPAGAPTFDSMTVDLGMRRALGDAKAHIER